MSLYLTIGGLTLPNNTVRVSGRTIRPVEFNRFIVAHDHELSVEGYLYADGPGNISTSMAVLETAVKTPNPAIALYSTDTGLTSHFLANTGTIGGVVLKSFQFVDTPLHMATQVKFQASWSAIYGNTSETRNIVSLVETVRIQGDGGPDDVLAPQAGLKSIYQRLKEYTDVMITQSGKIISRGTFASIPAPLISTPGAKISRGTTLQKSYKQVGTGILLREQDYSYQFQLPELPGGPVNPNYLQ